MPPKADDDLDDGLGFDPEKAGENDQEGEEWEQEGQIDIAGEEEPGDQGKETAAEEGKYGDRVQKRIDKEIAKRHQEERLRLQAESERDLLLARLTKLGASHSDLETQSLETRKQKLLEERKRIGLDEMLAGEEEGKRLEEIEDELADLRLELAARRRRAKELPVQRQEEPEPVSGQAPPAQADWYAKNRAWYDPQSPKYNPRAQQEADRIYYSMIDEGFNNGHPRFYAELNRRLEAGLKGNGRSHVAGPSPGYEGPARGNGNGAGLLQEDVEIMRDTGLDPSNPADRKKYLQRIGKGI